MADNEALKRDIAELQNLLVEAREDVRTLREEVEESRASALTAARPSPFRPEHMHTSSWASSFGQRPISPALRSAGLPIQPYVSLSNYKHETTNSNKHRNHSPRVPKIDLCLVRRVLHREAAFPLPVPDLDIHLLARVSIMKNGMSLQRLDHTNVP